MKLNKEERELLESVENGEWKSIPDVAEEIKRSRAIAEATSTKNERMNIRMNRRDMLALKARALELGIPYQTLVSSILRQWLRRAALTESSIGELGRLFSEQELERLASLLERYLKRPRKGGVMMVRESAAEGFHAIPPRGNPLLESLTSGNPKALGALSFTGPEAGELFSYLFEVYHRPELTDEERELMKRALDRVQAFVPRVMP